MRLTLSVLGVVGFVLVILSLNAPWLTFEPEDPRDWEWNRSIGYFSMDLVDLTTGKYNAYAIALYLVVVGAVMSISSLLGGFATLAGICMFVTGTLTEDRVIYLGGGGASVELSLSLGIGFYIALIGTALTLVSIWYPLDVSSDGRRHPKPDFRTWHLSRTVGA